MCVAEVLEAAGVNLDDFQIILDLSNNKTDLARLATADGSEFVFGTFPDNVEVSAVLVPTDTAFMELASRFNVTVERMKDLGSEFPDFMKQVRGSETANGTCGD